MLEAGKTTTQGTGSVHLLTVLKPTDVCTHTLTNTHIWPAVVISNPTHIISNSSGYIVQILSTEIHMHTVNSLLMIFTVAVKVGKPKPSRSNRTVAFFARKQLQNLIVSVLILEAWIQDTAWI